MSGKTIQRFAFLVLLTLVLAAALGVFAGTP